MTRFITVTRRAHTGAMIALPGDGNMVRVERFAINSYETYEDGVVLLYDGATLPVYETAEQLDEMLNTPISMFEGFANA